MDGVGRGGTGWGGGRVRYRASIKIMRNSKCDATLVSFFYNTLETTNFIWNYVLVIGICAFGTPN